MNLVLFKNTRQQVSTVNNIVATALCRRANGSVTPPERLDTARLLQASLFRRATTTDSGEDAALGEPSALDWAWVWEWVAGLKLE